MSVKGITQREIEDKQISLGSAMEDFILTEAGRYFMDMWDQKRALTCVEALLGKFEHKDDGDKKGQYKCKKLEEFWFQRGVAVGLKTVIDDINAAINVSRRLRKERLKEKGEESKT